MPPRVPCGGIFTGRILKMKRTFPVTDYGAIPNDDTAQTAHLQAAIDACYLSGGGEVTVPSGIYKTATLRLRSHVTLHLLEDAVLLGSRDPEDYTHFCEDPLEPPKEVEDGMFSRTPLSRWYNAILRAYLAEDIRIIGERGSRIDGQNCYDAQGEEGFRGPHAIAMYGCSGIELCGYTVTNSANWAHCITRCRNIYAHEVTVFAGHDGIHCRACENVLIADCTLHTGDDSVAGFNNVNMSITGCELNSSCSAFRLGGTNILIDRCRVFGPGRYGHRYTMSDEDKRAGIPTDDRHRHNTLNGFLYFCYGTFPLKADPGNIIVQNTDFENVGCLFSLEFGQHIWCCNRSLGDITFRNCHVHGISEPIRAYSDASTPLSLRMTDVHVSRREGSALDTLLVGQDVGSIELQRVTAQGYDGGAHLDLRFRQAENGSTAISLHDCEGIVASPTT